MTLCWHFQSLVDPETVPDTVFSAILQVFQDGFGLPDGWSLEGVRYALLRSDVLGLLCGSSGIDGYAFYTVPEVQLEGRHVLWEDAICLRQCVQGMGYGSRALSEAAAFLPHHDFGWVGGRTQNPVVFLRYACLGSVFPFDEPYTDPRGKRVMDFLITHIIEVQESERAGRLERTTGICRGIYDEGKLGVYDVGLQASADWEVSLKEWGFDRLAGDALLLVARLTELLT